MIIGSDQDFAKEINFALKVHVTNPNLLFGPTKGKKLYTVNPITSTNI